MTMLETTLRGALCALALCAAAIPSTSTAADAATTVKIGSETKRTTGVVTALHNGDVACLVMLKDDKGVEFAEAADFEICSRNPSLLGKRVSLKYQVANVMSASCQGDPDCKKSERIALISEAKIVGGGAQR
jgi:hypothetical protein